MVGRDDADELDRVFDAVLRNTELLERILQHVVDGRLGGAEFDFDPASFSDASGDAIDAVDENIRLRERIDELEALVDQQGTSGQTQNAPALNTTTPQADQNEPLSWEDRKLQILDQMENDSFDAESFLSTLQSGAVESNVHVSLDNPADGLHELFVELERRGELIGRLEEEKLLLQQAENQAVADERSNAIAEAVDADEVILQEREKLRDLQVEWEERFRTSEIEASLERAKLSRERLEIELKNEQLEQEIAALKRQVESGGEAGGSVGTRWMAKLGFTSDKNGE